MLFVPQKHVLSWTSRLWSSLLLPAWGLRTMPPGAFVSVPGNGQPSHRHWCLLQAKWQAQQDRGEAGQQPDSRGDEPVRTDQNAANMRSLRDSVQLVRTHPILLRPQHHSNRYLASS